MQLTIIAATGGIGRHLLDQALAAGHDVTAVARRPERLAGTTRPVRVAGVDLTEPDRTVLEPAVAGADAVLSGLGPRTMAESGIASCGTAAVVAAMAATGVRRIVVVSAAPVGSMPAPGDPRAGRPDPGDGPVMRYLLSPLLRRAFRRHYLDLAGMEGRLRDSGLEWTVVRPPRLTGRPLSGHYRSAYGRNLPGGLTISRADVAHRMLQALAEPESVHQVIGIAY